MDWLYPPANWLHPPADEASPPADEASPLADEASPPADEANLPTDEASPICLFLRTFDLLNYPFWPLIDDLPKLVYSPDGKVDQLSLRSPMSLNDCVSISVLELACGPFYQQGYCVYIYNVFQYIYYRK